MKAICEGVYPSGYRGITKKVACEYIKGQSPKGLPTKVKKTKPKKKKAPKKKGKK